jgi:hypothetical protein
MSCTLYVQVLLHHARGFGIKFLGYSHASYNQSHFLHM